MSTVFAFISNLKLSLSQIAVGAVAAIVGLLVLALRLQGSKLHATQVALLQAQYGNALDSQAKKVANAEQRYQEAYKAFEESK